MAWLVGIGIFLFLLFAFPKQVGGLLLLLGIGVGLLFWAGQQESEQRRAEQRSVSAKAAYDVRFCKEPFPISVAFSNLGRRATSNITFGLQAHRPGFSKAVLDGYRETDRIIQPGETYVLCWAVPTQFGEEIPTDVNQLIWSAPIGYVTFQ